MGAPGADLGLGTAWLATGPFVAHVDLAAARARILGTSSLVGLGTRVAGADLDGDGFADILVSAQGPVDSEPGGARMFRGPLVGQVPLEDADAWIQPADLEASEGGRVLDPLGDLDGDGHPTFSLGRFTRTSLGSEVIYLFEGPLSGAVDLASDDAAVITAGPDDLGERLASGDVDGDGLREVAVVGAQEVAAWIVDPSESGAMDLLHAEIRVTTEEGEDGSRVLALGDLDGDGYDDLALGSAGSGSGGWVGVLPGPWTGRRTTADALWVLTGTDDSQTGADLALVDWDGDGLQDVCVGAPGAGDAGPGTGLAALYLGPVLGAQDLDGAWVRLQGTGPQDGLGTRVTPAGDLNRDGVQDLLVGAPGEDTGGRSAGAAWVVLGGQGW